MYIKQLDGKYACRVPYSCVLLITEHDHTLPN